MKATAIAGANIALIKYWGRADDRINLPLTNSVSLTLDKLTTRTTVEFDTSLRSDTLAINGAPQSGRSLARVVGVMDRIRDRAKTTAHARIASTNSFAAAAGMASSASAFAALPTAAFAALGVRLSPEELSAFARLGSGSACRSVLGGFVEWVAGTDHATSVAQQIAPASHMDLHDVVLVFSDEEKAVKSAEGHAFAKTSPLNLGRLTAVADMLPRLRAAIAARDLSAMGEIAEQDALLMHSVMMTSSPSLAYWKAETIEGIHAVRRWRAEGLPCYFTIDAGPNLHVLVEGSRAPEVVRRARETFRLPPERIVDAGPGEGARLVPDHLF